MLLHSYFAKVIVHQAREPKKKKQVRKQQTDTAKPNDRIIRLDKYLKLLHS